MRKDIINTFLHVSRPAPPNSAMCQNSQISLSLLNRPKSPRLLKVPILAIYAQSVQLATEPYLSENPIVVCNLPDFVSSQFGYLSPIGSPAAIGSISQISPISQSGPITGCLGCLLATGLLSTLLAY